MWLHSFLVIGSQWLSAPPWFTCALFTCPSSLIRVPVVLSVLALRLPHLEYFSSICYFYQDDVVVTYTFLSYCCALWETAGCPRLSSRLLTDCLCISLIQILKPFFSDGTRDETFDRASRWFLTTSLFWTGRCLVQTVVKLKAPVPLSPRGIPSQCSPLRGFTASDNLTENFHSVRLHPENAPTWNSCIFWHHLPVISGWCLLHHPLYYVYWWSHLHSGFTDRTDCSCSGLCCRC